MGARTFSAAQVAAEAARLQAARQARGGARLVLPPREPALINVALAQQAIDELSAQLLQAQERLLQAQAERMRAELSV